MAVPKGRFYREFGKKLAQTRRSANVTQEALAKAIGLSRTSIVNIEKGRQPVHIHLVARMAFSLDAEIADLLPEPVPAAESEISKVSATNRPWVERVITASALQEESEDGTEILARPTQSNGSSSKGKNKKAPGRR